MRVPIEKNKITGFIGPRLRQSTVLRSLNRMNDLIPIFSFKGKVTYHGQDIYDKRSTRWWCVVISAWCSNSPTRSR